MNFYLILKFYLNKNYGVEARIAVRPRHGRIVRRTEVLVQDRDFPLRRGQARKNHEAEWFPNAVTVPAALLNFGHADKRVAGIDQI